MKEVFGIAELEASSEIRVGESTTLVFGNDGMLHATEGFREPKMHRAVTVETYERMIIESKMRERLRQRQNGQKNIEMISDIISIILLG